MVARGQERAWHFAHEAPATECADPDRALHETAKVLIAQGLTDAVSAGAEYRVGFACQGCQTPLSWNIALPGTRAALERSVVGLTRSDVLIDRPQKQPLIVEVVVSHDLEDDTKRRCSETRGSALRTLEIGWLCNLGATTSSDARCTGPLQQAVFNQ